ncbi:MAG: hypothetical protein U0169_20650 [Polyangiaceae bacterium]
MASRIAFGLVLLVLAVVGSACGGAKDKGPTLPPRVSTGTDPFAGPRLRRPEEIEAAAGVAGHVIARVGDKTVGPLLARSESGAMATYVGTTESAVRSLVSVALTPTLEATAAPRILATLPSETTTLVLRSVDPAGSAYAAAWVALTERGASLSVMAIGRDGQALSPVNELTRTNDHVVWVDIVPTAKGALCMWAEETRLGDANLLLVPLDGAGKPRGVPSRFARAATGWHATRFADGVGVALVTPVPKSALSGPRSSVSFLRLDADGRPRATPTFVAEKVALVGDVELSGDGRDVTLGWTEHSGLEPEARMTVLGADGAVKVPTFEPFEGGGGSSLVSIVRGKSGTLAVWEEPSRRKKNDRRLHLAFARHDAPKTFVAGDLVEVSGKNPFEATVAGEGFGMLAVARTCGPVAETMGGCGVAPWAPTFMRVDARAKVTNTLPIRLVDVGATAAIAWSADCSKEPCVALAATADFPTPIRGVELPAAPTPFRPPSVAEPPAAALRLGEVHTIATGANYVDIATARVGGELFVAHLSESDPNVDVAPVPPSRGKNEKTAKGDRADKGSAADADSRKGSEPGRGSKEKATAKSERAPRILRPRGLTLTVERVDASGRPTGESHVITNRALAMGRVAFAAGGTPEDGAALVWVGRDNGDPEVHVTRIDRRGRRMKDVQLTTAKGDASDVAVAWTKGGWIVAWVDARNGDGEVYATKVSTDLARIAREERITKAPGDASDVVLMSREDAIWLAWSDPRESPSEGMGDIYVTTLRGRDAKRATEEVAVLSTAAHSRSPVLASSGDDIALAWIEEAAQGIVANPTNAHGAVLAWLDPRGLVSGEPVRIRTAGDGVATAVALEGRDDSIRIVVTRSTTDDLVLDAGRISPIERKTPTLYFLVGLEGPPSMSVPLVLENGALLVSDEGGMDGVRRLRRATLATRK